jgi:hypothetical protein
MASEWSNSVRKFHKAYVNFVVSYVIPETGATILGRIIVA